MHTVRARPVDAFTAWTVRKGAVLACDIGRDCECGFLMRYHDEHRVTGCAAACGSVTEIEFKVQLRSDLPKLVLQMVADNERMVISKDLALHEVAISGEEPPTFCQDTFGQRLIGNDLFVGCVISECPEPAGQSAEHRVGEEHRLRNDLCIQRLHASLYPA